MMKLFLGFLMFMFSFVPAKAQNDTSSVDPKTVFGIASYYSKFLEGSKTATGERFSHHKLMAASNAFALNSWVRVTNIKNGKSIIVRINDRMNKRMVHKGRVIDITRPAARELGFLTHGLTKVKVEQVPADTVE